MSTPSSSKKATPTLFPLPEAWVQTVFAQFGDTLAHWQEKKKIPHALLLTGMEGVGKRPLAHLICQWANCEKTGFAPPLDSEPVLFGELSEPKDTLHAKLSPPCGSCLSCQRLIHGNSVDLVELTSESATDSASASDTIKIDALRDLKNSARFGSFNSAFRFIIIPGAERLTPQATNSLLKVLEEPPDQWVFILTVSDRSLLLPTIASRCQVLRLSPLPETQCARIVETTSGIPAEQALTQSRLALGCLFRALEELKSEKLAKARDQVREFIRDPQTHYLATIDWAAQSTAEHSALIDLLEYDLHRKLKAEPKSGRDLELALLVQSHREKIGLPLNRKLTVQSLLAHWLTNASG